MVLPVRVLTKICIPPRSRRTKCRVDFLLDVVVSEGAAVLQLLAGEDQTLLIGGMPSLSWIFCLDVLDGVRWLDVQGDGLAGQGLDEDLHSTTQSKHQVEGGLLLDVVVSEGAAVLQLLSGEDQTLLVGRDAFLVLDLCLDVLDGVDGSTSRVMVLPVRVLTKICILVLRSAKLAHTKKAEQRPQRASRNNTRATASKPPPRHPHKTTKTREHERRSARSTTAPPQQQRPNDPPPRGNTKRQQRNETRTAKRRSSNTATTTTQQPTLCALQSMNSRCVRAVDYRLAVSPIAR